jgi:hypothetical protein
MRAILAIRAESTQGRAILRGFGCSAIQRVRFRFPLTICSSGTFVILLVLGDRVRMCQQAGPILGAATSREALRHPVLRARSLNATSSRHSMHSTPVILPLL